jgi:hypothetical protein
MFQHNKRANAISEVPTKDQHEILWDTGATLSVTA